MEWPNGLMHVHEATGRTLANIGFERELRLPTDLLHDRPPDKPQTRPKYASYLQKQLEAVHTEVRKKIQTRELLVENQIRC